MQRNEGGRLASSEELIFSVDGLCIPAVKLKQAAIPAGTAYATNSNNAHQQIIPRKTLWLCYSLRTYKHSHRNAMENVEEEN